jgi:hypothetical protein
MADTQPRSPTARAVRFDATLLHVALTDGRSLSVPLDWYPWLAELNTADRQQYELIGGGTGIWWTLPDEGLSVPALFGLPCE